MKIDILTLFPDMFTSLNHSILGKARDKNILDINIIDYRKFSGNKHNQVDDYPFGGGQGMVLKPEPIFNAVESLNKTDKTRIILLCPQGERFNQKKAEELSKEDHLIFICGHYEGYDERIREYLVTDELSIGDFILTGGEFAAMTMVDSIARLIPDVLGKEESHKDDSFSTGLLEYPQYTRPKDYKGMLVPDVLTSGHHKNIEKYRMKESLRRTYIRRPDLLENYDLSEEEAKILDEIKKELRNSRKINDIIYILLYNTNIVCIVSTGGLEVMTTSFEELLNSSEMLKKGDKVTGTVSKIENDKVYVDVAGAQYDCVILRNQITRKPFENIEEVLSVGDEVEAQVTGIRTDREKRSEDVPGVIYLSHKILENAEYRKLMELSWAQLIEKFENGEYITATVSSQTKGGLLADVDGLRAFIPGSYIDTKFRKDLSKFVGNEYTFKIEEVDKAKNKIILNRRVILEEEKAKKLAEVYGNINEGDVIEGKVSRITNFGAFVNIGEVDGLLHISEISHSRLEKVEDALSVGDTVKVAVIAVDKENEKISLSAKTLLPTQWEVARATIKAGDVLEGVVRNTTAFGAFVEVMDDVEGLVHISQISHDRVNNVTDVLNIGDKVSVKVLDVDFENERLSLSIKELQEKPVKEEPEYDTSFLKEEDTSFSVGDKFKDLEL